MTKLIDHGLLTLDFWQSNVTYGGKSLPSGAVGCAALNISDEVIADLNRFCTPLNFAISLVSLGQLTVDALSPAKESVIQIVERLRGIPPFSYLGVENAADEVTEIFTDENMKTAAAYTKAAAEIGLAAAADEQYKGGIGLLKLIQVTAQLGGTVTAYKRSMIRFAEQLHESDRTADGYAAVFGKYFSSEPTLSQTDPSWMALSNVSVQYVSAVMPGRDEAQLVKRMHYVSFVGMFRSDLFEGLCAGHAPRKCPICGKWFLTTDARHTKYCGEPAPNDPKGRTCRQIGNLKGREQRELAADHPIKLLYENQTGSIRKLISRGTLDAQLGKIMKKLAKDKMLRAISDPVYAKTEYAKEMEHDALTAEARKYLR